jgi:hypothetical protein
MKCDLLVRNFEKIRNRTKYKQEMRRNRAVGVYVHQFLLFGGFYGRRYNSGCHWGVASLSILKGACVNRLVPAEHGASGLRITRDL